MATEPSSRWIGCS
ncbi:hypothetical protein OIU79_019052 [Salix purpurea]|uniref:Uncharacterized protein n=1 Tax=Salix purpurea TaxID=77065 RepID=A0A9Q0SJE4_SALPP|nr:hypothetical protein OIU79_019052 [Salix purpurea]